MKLLWGHKDGGPESQVTCYGLEIKSLFSVMLLRFTPETREEFHSHAFDCYNWVLTGGLYEEIAYSPYRFITLSQNASTTHLPSWRGFWIKRECFHRVRSMYQTSWVLSFRGPWKPTWSDGLPGQEKTLTHGRKEVTGIKKG